MGSIAVSYGDIQQSDETSVPHMETNDTTMGDANNMVLKTPELDPLARSKTKARAKKWSPSEVVKLIQGVRNYGAGNWVQIQKSLFIGHRRSTTNLKDKWRNLVAASCKSAHGKVGGKKSSIPDHILVQVRELAEKDMKEFKTKSSSSSSAKDNIMSSTSKENSILLRTL